MAIMINQLIDKNIAEYLQSFKEDYKYEGFDFEIYSDLDGIEITGYYNNISNPNEKTPFVLLRLFILQECKQIQISNIFLPTFMRHRAIGKKIISNIFAISKEQKYELFIIEMVNSFYQRMKNRGAIPCNNCDDAVQIIDTTNLNPRNIF